MVNWIFTTPTVEEAPFAWNPLHERFRMPRGISVQEVSPGVFEEIRYYAYTDEIGAVNLPPNPNELDTPFWPAQSAGLRFYRGGYEHTVSDQDKQDLINSGLVTEANFRVADISTVAISLDQTAQELLRTITLSQNTVAQSIAYDQNWMYICQIIQDGVQLPGEPAPVPFSQRENNGDIAINRVAFNGSVDSVMYVRGSGHGAGIGVEPGSGLLWIDADASGSGFARAIGRIAFQPNAVYDSLVNVEIFRPFGPASQSHGLAVSIDQTNKKLAVRRTFPDPDNGFGRRHYLYDLSRAIAGDFTQPLAVIDQEANHTDSAPGTIGTFQGWVTFGNYFYSIEGNPNTPNSYISRTSWLTGTQESRVYLGIFSDLNYREPEGLAIQIPDPLNFNTYRMVFGFASGTDNARKYNLGFFPVIPPVATAGTFGRDGYGSGGFGQ